MTELKDLRKPQYTKVPFSSLQVGQAYEDELGNFCIKTSLSFDDDKNCIYLNTNTRDWESEYEFSNSEVLPPNIEITILS